MTHTYKITGMTCDGCRQSVENTLSQVEGISSVSVELDAAEATVQFEKFVSIDILQQALKPKYFIFERSTVGGISTDIHEAPSKFKQLMPLFLILSGILLLALLLNSTTWSIQAIMLDYMGLFFLVFSFFKLLDLKGFPPAFSMYDPIAKVLTVYGWIYPFLEIALGLMFLTRFQIEIALIATVFFLGITTIGVTRSLLAKRKIRCACLGTVLNLPMTEATFIENAIMLVMAVIMLSNTLSI